MHANLSSHSDSCLSNEFLGYCLLQNWHSDGSSETAFSTARFLVADALLISVRQLGHVAVSSRRRASASMWVKHPAHIRCPLLHCNTHAQQIYEIYVFLKCKLRFMHMLSVKSSTFYICKCRNLRSACLC